MCTRCLDFFSVAHTPCLCSTISYNSMHYTYLAYTYIYIVGYAYAYILSLYTYIHTQAHANLYIHIRMCIPAYNIHSFTHRQYTAILTYTCTDKAAAYLIHTSAQLHPLAHTTVYVIHLHRDTHSYTSTNNNSIIHIDMYKRY